MKSMRILAPVLVAAAFFGAVPVAGAQTVLTMSSWVGPTHLLTRDVLQAWATSVEKATNGRVKFQMLPKAPSAAPGTFDAVRDGLVDVSYVTASYTPARHPLPLLAELPGAGATRRDQFGRVLAHPLEVPAGRQRIQGRQAARRLHARAGPDVHGEEEGRLARRSRRHEDPHRRRHRRAGRQGARRVAVRQARARLVRAALVGRRRRHLLPVGVDQVLQPRQGRPLRDLLPGRLLLFVVRLLHEPGQVGQAAQAGPGRHPVGVGRGAGAARRQGLGRGRQGRHRGHEGRQRARSRRPARPSSPT